MKRFVTLIHTCTWITLLLTAIILLTSCSPYVAVEPTETAELTTTPLPSQTASPSCTVTGGTVNLRTGAGMSYAVIDVLEHGDVLTVTKRGTWLNVSTGTKTGFIYSKYCK